MDKFQEFLEWAEKNQWRLEIKKEESLNLPPEITNRYHDIPDEYMVLLTTVKSLSNKAKSVWFITEEDFHGKGQPYTYTWNHPELAGIEQAQGDNALANDIRSWWNKRLPIMYIIDDGYRFYAIDLDSGSIVTGKQPEFENTETVANSLSDFLSRIIIGHITF